MKVKRSHIINAALLGFLLLMLFSPSSKAWVSQGLMKLGLFKPTLEAPEVASEPTQMAEVGSSTDSEVSLNNAPVRFTDSKGTITDAANLNGKVVFINFWATWCPPCIAEMPSIEKLYDEFKDNENIVFLIVDVDNQLVQSEAWMAKKKLNLPVHVALGDIPSTWLGSSIPTTIILDKKGNIATRHEGMADYSKKEVFDFINKLIAD